MNLKKKNKIQCTRAYPIHGQKTVYKGPYTKSGAGAIPPFNFNPITRKGWDKKRGNPSRNDNLKKRQND